MQIKQIQDVPQSNVTMEGAAGCRVRWLIGEGDKAPNFAMREFEVEPRGHTPKHLHDYEHEVYVLAGRGAIVWWDCGVAPRPDHDVRVNLTADRLTHGVCRDG